MGFNEGIGAVEPQIITFICFICTRHADDSRVRHCNPLQAAPEAVCLNKLTAMASSNVTAAAICLARLIWLIYYQ